MPYEFGEKTLLMHPDFLFWHDDGDGEYVMDIVDPHRHDLADAGAEVGGAGQVRAGPPRSRPPRASRSSRSETSTVLWT